MLKPVLLIACLVSMSGGIFAAEEKKDVQAVKQFRSFPGKNVAAEVWRLTVDPPKGSYLIAKVQEFGNIKLPDANDKPLRETTRIIWTSGGSWSEDIIWTSYQKGASAPSRSILTGFGQQLDLGVMILSGSGGGSSSFSTVNEKKEGAAKIRRRFHFADDATKPTVWNTVYFILESTNPEEVLKLALTRGVSLPDAGDRPWSITLPPSTDEITAPRVRDLK